MFFFCLLVALQNQVNGRGMREFRGAAKSAILDVKLLGDRSNLRVDYAGIELRPRSREDFRLSDRIGQMVCRLDKIGSFVLVRIRDCQKNAPESGPPHLIFRRKIRATVEGFSIGQKKSSQRPSPLSGNGA